MSRCDKCGAQRHVCGHVTEQGVDEAVARLTAPRFTGASVPGGIPTIEPALGSDWAEANAELTRGLDQLGGATIAPAEATFMPPDEFTAAVRRGEFLPEVHAHPGGGFLKFGPRRKHRAQWALQ